MSRVFQKIYKKISAEKPALISVIQFVGCPLHLPHDTRQAALHSGAAKIQFCCNIHLWKLLHKVELRNLFVFSTKIRLMNDRFHVPAHQSAKLRR